MIHIGRGECTYFLYEKGLFMHAPLRRGIFSQVILIYEPKRGRSSPRFAISSTLLPLFKLAKSRVAYFKYSIVTRSKIIAVVCYHAFYQPCAAFISEDISIIILLKGCDNESKCTFCLCGCSNCTINYVVLHFKAFQKLRRMNIRIKS